MKSLHLLISALTVFAGVCTPHCQAATLTLNVKIDPPVHDCRFQPILTDTAGLPGITDVRMDLYENAPREFSYSLLHKEYEEPLPAAEFHKAFGQFKLMPDGFYADNLGYYHTTWHRYLLTVTLADGSVLEALSRPFRVPENPFHIFCAQIVSEPYMGRFTYKPASTIIYNTGDADPSTGQLPSCKKVADISKMADMYANWQTTWTDNALVFGQLPDDARNARNVLWTLSSTGGSVVNPVVSTDIKDFAYQVTVRHFGEEDFNLSLQYTLADSHGNDSTVSVSNHQYIKMRLPTPCFAYDNAVYSKVGTENQPLDIAITADDLSGTARESNLVDATEGTVLSGARLLHLDMLSYLQVSPNMFDNSDIVLEITVTDTKNPDDPAKSESRTYGPFLYNYNNRETSVGVLTLKDCRPSDWFSVDPSTGKVTPVKHKLTVTYASGTHEFYYAADKNTSVWQANPSFDAPQVSFAGTSDAVFRNIPGKGWHEFLRVPALGLYEPGALYVNNSTAIPEAEGDSGFTDYYAVASRWPSGSGYDYGCANGDTSYTPRLIAHSDMVGSKSGGKFLLGHVLCGDGEYTGDMFLRNWFTESQFEAAVGRAYLFAYSPEPLIELSIAGEQLQPESSPAPRRAAAAPHAEAFIPAMSSDTFQVGRINTGTQQTDIPASGISVCGNTVTAPGCQLRVYDMEGREAAAGFESVTLPSGLYIAVTMNGSRKLRIL